MQGYQWLQLIKRNKIMCLEYGSKSRRGAIKNGTVRISVYDKREDFNFKIVNFPYLDSNIPRNPAYGVYISQLVRYARICSRKDDFIYRHRRLSLKLQQQGYKYQQLMKSFHKFYRSHSDELKKFGTTLMELRSSI